VPPNNASKWQMGFNSAFKGLKNCIRLILKIFYRLQCTSTGLVRVSEVRSNHVNKQNLTRNYVPHKTKHKNNFYVLLTVHLCVIFVNKTNSVHSLFSVYL